MTHPHEQQHPRDQIGGNSKQAPDLHASEIPLAAWFSTLERPDAPAALRTAVLASSLTSSPAARPSSRLSARPAGRLLSLFTPQGFPLGGWGLATAALLLIAFGAVAWVEATDTIPGPGSGAPIATQPAGSLVIVEDPTMPLFHGFETFDEVGLDPDELIADWSR